MDTQNTYPQIMPTSSCLTLANWWDHWLARWAYRRMEHRVTPGLYALGNPKPDAPVLITANYSLSFDALRSALKEQDAYILVLDTSGVNVWCAAGKGTFGTDELVKRIQAVHLDEIVTRRVLILPQLGAPGVAAHEVKKRTGFKVEYGPVRAADLPAYLQAHQATLEMRRVRFTLKDRLMVIPVELVAVLIPLLIIWLLLNSLPAIAATLAGVVLFPLLLPWLPTRDFSTKGLILGGLVVLPFALASYSNHADWSWWLRILQALVPFLIMPPITAYLALNFTGSTTFTSRSGVRKEIFSYIPVIAWMFAAGILLNIAIVIIL